MATKLDARQIVSRDLLDQVATATGKEVDDLLRSINEELTPPLRLKPSSPADLVLNIENIQLTNPETSIRRTIPPISNVLPAFTSGTVTFPASSGGNATPSVGTPVVITVTTGNFLKVGISLDALGNIVVQPGTQGASEAAATTPPLVNNTFPIGMVVLQNVGGTIQNITSARIIQYVGGGGGGSGSGDASSITTRLQDKLADSSYKQLSAVDLASDEDDHVDGSSTGSFSLVSQSFEFSGIGQTLVTSQLLSAEEFLDQEKDLVKVSVSIVWDPDALDTGATYSISRDGGVNWQTLSMERVGEGSDVYEGEHIFTDEPSLSSLVTQATTDGSYDLNATTQQKLAQSFVLPDSSAVKQLDLFLTKTGSPSGYIYVALHRDNVGAPGDAIVETQAVAISGLSTGSNLIDIPTTALDGVSTYWVVIRTDAGYKSSYSNGVTEISLHSNSAGSGLSSYNGTSWSGTGDGLKFTLSGRELDLRLRVTSSVADVALKGYGVFYEPESGAVGGVKNIDVFEFLSNTDNDNIFSLSFLPDPELLRVYHVQTGQTYVWPAFSIDGQDIIFPASSFLQDSDETVTLRVSQLEGSSFDNSDANGNKIATLEDSLESVGAALKQVNLTYLTPVNGTPSAGQFRSDISGRAKVVDLTNDLMPRLGIERINIQRIQLANNETGPSGQLVYKVPNDPFERVRFVGGNFYNELSTVGQSVGSGSTTTGYAEVVFVGTGLNMLSAYIDGSNRSVAVSVDGGAETTVNRLGNTVLTSRGYTPNIITPLVSGLSYGLHTVKIRPNGAADTSFTGFDILNEATSIKTSAGSAIVNGQKRTLLAADTQLYNSGFESGTLGTRGGRVVMYMRNDGVINKAVTPTNASTAYLTSADHSSEEVIRTYHYREFGSGRSDDFSSLVPGVASNRAGILDDGTVSLLGSSVRSSVIGTTDTLNLGNGAGVFVIINFVGTGLDIVRMDNAGGSETLPVIVDGAAAGNLNSSGSAIQRVEKIVSGLPYGSHSVRITQSTVSAYGMGICQFIVYGPKKPTIPADAIELADYNVVADFSGNTTPGQDNISQGLIRKFTSQREAVYSGTWSTSLDISGAIGGWNTNSSTSSSYMEHTFWGTGFEIRGEATSAALTGTVQLKAGSGSLLALTTANFPTISSANYSSGFVFNSGTGALTQTGSVGHSGFRVTGLPLGLYTLRITNTSAQNLRLHAFDVITPIHIHKNNGPHVVQNVASLGSVGINDLRVFKNQLKIPANSSRADHVTLNPSSTSTTNLPVPDMMCTHYSKTGMIDVSFCGLFSHSISQVLGLAVYVDGNLNHVRMDANVNTDQKMFTQRYVIPVTPGWHTVWVSWRTGAGTMNADVRSMTVADVQSEQGE